MVLRLVLFPSLIPRDKRAFKCRGRGRDPRDFNPVRLGPP